MDMGQWNVIFRTVWVDAAGGLRGEAEQRLDGGRGLRAGTLFEHLAEQGQRNDYRRRLEIDADPAVGNE